SRVFRRQSHVARSVAVRPPEYDSLRRVARPAPAESREPRVVPDGIVRRSRVCRSPAPVVAWKRFHREGFAGWNLLLGMGPSPPADGHFGNSRVRGEFSLPVSWEAGGERGMGDAALSAENRGAGIDVPPLRPVFRPRAGRSRRAGSGTARRGRTTAGALPRERRIRPHREHLAHGNETLG